MYNKFSILILGGQCPGGPRNEKQTMTGLYWGEGEASVTQAQNENEKRRKKKKEKYSDQGGKVVYVWSRACITIREFEHESTVSDGATRSSTERHDEDIRGFKSESLLRIIIIELKAIKEDFVT